MKHIMVLATLLYHLKINNLIISRSLSKYGGIAGLRVGYLLTNKSLAKLFYNIKPTYEINSVGIEIACEILKKIICG